MGFLEDMIAATRGRLATLPHGERRRPRAGEFAEALRGKDEITVIAELKRRSPSGGALSPDADAADVVRSYAACGAGALSILTEPTCFGGTLADLAAASSACGLPAMMKDFVIDPEQVRVAALYGAAAVLVIARAVDERTLDALVRAAADRRLDVVLECHDASDLRRALERPEVIIGLNNRDLETLRVDRSLAPRLAREIPPDRIVVAESGYRSPHQVRALRGVCDAVLIGTALMRGGDARRFVEEAASCE